MESQFLVLLHNAEKRCPACDTVVAEGPGSYVIDSDGKPVLTRTSFPFPLQFSVQCDCGKRVILSTRESLSKSRTPEAPQPRDIEKAVTLETPLPRG
jgi:hypothetical protein